MAEQSGAAHLSNIDIDTYATRKFAEVWRSDHHDPIHDHRHHRERASGCFSKMKDPHCHYLVLVYCSYSYDRLLILMRGCIVAPSFLVPEVQPIVVKCLHG